MSYKKYQRRKLSQCDCVFQKRKAGLHSHFIHAREPIVFWACVGLCCEFFGRHSTFQTFFSELFFYYTACSETNEPFSNSSNFRCVLFTILKFGMQLESLLTKLLIPFKSWYNYFSGDTLINLTRCQNDEVENENYFIFCEITTDFIKTFGFSAQIHHL